MRKPSRFFSFLQPDGNGLPSRARIALEIRACICGCSLASAPLPRWGPTSLTSLQGAMVVRDGRREPQPVRGSTASRSPEAVGRPLPRGSLLPWAPRTNEKPWQERRRPRGSYRPLPTRTIHDVVTYANAFGRPHARYKKNGLLAVSRHNRQAGSIDDVNFHVPKTTHDVRHHSVSNPRTPSNDITGQRYKRGNGTRVLVTR